MLPTYTAIDMIRTMNQELVERHQRAAVDRELSAVQRERRTFSTLKEFVTRGRS
jgi:hypothetical protein